VSTDFGVNELRNQFGAFARIFREDTADALAERFVEFDLKTMQFNFSALGYPALPHRDLVERLDLAGIAASFASRGIQLWGVSGTYNMAHPDRAIREETTRLAAGYIAAIGPIEADAVTLCTGSRDPDHMWRRHPENGSEAAWTDFRSSIDVLLPAAAEAGVKLAIEPEPGNVVTGTAQARRLVAELGGDANRIGFILDPANLVGDAPMERHEAILGEAFSELGSRTLCLHGKDPNGWTTVLDGQGGVDYAQVFALYRQLPHPVPFIVQDATPEQLPRVRDLMLDAFDRAGMV
jgi:sugar phosphate isomerase/epimerase